jgi:SHS2 domain-containing protein
MEGMLFLDYRVESLHDSPELRDSSSAASLVAYVGGVQALATRAHIKAATFHNLSLVQNESGWSTVITFDT